MKKEGKGNYNFFYSKRKPVKSLKIRTTPTYTTGFALSSMMFLAWISSWRILRICENPKLNTFVCKEKKMRWLESRLNTLNLGQNKKKNVTQIPPNSRSNQNTPFSSLKWGRSLFCPRLNLRQNKNKMHPPPSSHKSMTNTRSNQNAPFF